MPDVAEVRVNREAVKMHVGQASRDLKRPTVWIFRWALSLGLLLIVLQVFAVISHGWAESFGVRSTLYTGAIAAGLATGITWLGRRFARRSEAELIDSIQQNWLQLTGPGWVRRIVLFGTGMGTLIGVMVGSLLASVVEATFHPAVGVLLFVSLTLAWTIPMAFAIRLISIRQHRRFVLKGE